MIASCRFCGSEVAAGTRCPSCNALHQPLPVFCVHRGQSTGSVVQVGCGCATGRTVAVEIYECGLFTVCLPQRPRYGGWKGAACSDCTQKPGG